MLFFLRHNRAGAFALAALCLAALAPADALAGTGGTEFAAVWTQLSGWISGTLGKIAAGAMILVGVFIGLMRQSAMAFVTGVGLAIGLNLAPSVVDNIVTGTAAVDPALLEGLPAAIDLLGAVAAL